MYYYKTIILINFLKFEFRSNESILYLLFEYPTLYRTGCQIVRDMGVNIFRTYRSKVETYKLKKKGKKKSKRKLLAKKKESKNTAQMDEDKKKEEF